MKFSIKEWRCFYDKVQSLSKILKGSRQRYRGNNPPLPPVIQLSESAKHKIEDEIKLLMMRSDRYLDQFLTEQ